MSITTDRLSVYSFTRASGLYSLKTLLFSATFLLLLTGVANESVADSGARATFTRVAGERIYHTWQRRRQGRRVYSRNRTRSRSGSVGRSLPSYSYPRYSYPSAGNTNPTGGSGLSRRGSQRTIESERRRRMQEYNDHQMQSSGSMYDERKEQQERAYNIMREHTERQTDAVRRITQ